MDNTLIQELLSAKNPAEKAAIAAEFCLSGLPEEVAHIARECVLFHWFDQTVIQSLLQSHSTMQLKTDQVYEQIRALSFVETHPWGLRFQDLTREGLLRRYTKTRPELLQQAAKFGASAYEKRQDDKKVAAELLFCCIVAGEQEESKQLLHVLQEQAYKRSDWRYLRSLLEMQERAESFPFVRPLPVDEDGWMLRGLVSQSKGEQEQAIKSYSKLLAMNPLNVLAYVHRGAVYAKQRQLKKALRDYNKALQITPDLAVAHAGRGSVYVQEGDYTSALTDFNAAIRQNPEDSSLYHHKGTILHLLDDNQEALAALDEALRLDPYCADAYREKGAILNEQGKYQEALAVFDEVLRLDPYHADDYRGKGRALSGLKQYEQASLVNEEAEFFEAETTPKSGGEFGFSQADGEEGKSTNKKLPLLVRAIQRRRNGMAVGGRSRSKNQPVRRIRSFPIWQRVISVAVAVTIILASFLLFWRSIPHTTTNSVLTIILGGPTPTPTPKPIPTADARVTGSCSSIPTEGNCTGQDPYTQRCQMDAYTVTNSIIKANNGNSIGQVDLRYSTTCQSNWARTTVFTSCGHASIDASVKRPNHVYQGIAYPEANYDFAYNKDCMEGISIDTNMVYAPGNVTAQACGAIDGSKEVCTKRV